MNSSIFEQRSRFAMIGALMVIISLMFLFFSSIRFVFLPAKIRIPPDYPTFRLLVFIRLCRYK